MRVKNISQCFYVPSQIRFHNKICIHLQIFSVFFFSASEYVHKFLVQHKSLANKCKNTEILLFPKIKLFGDKEIITIIIKHVTS